MNEYEILINTLQKANFDEKTLIDVGAHRGHFVTNCGITFDYKVGIDPLVYPEQSIYDYFVNAVVSSSKHSKLFYIHENEGCSSLLKMKSSDVTHNFSEREKKWYVPFQIENVKKIISVSSISLEKIIDEHFADKTVSLIKVDAQGTDIDVIKSLGKYINTDKVHYLYIELPSRDIVLYNDQLDFQNSVQILDQLGFSVLHKHDFEIFGYNNQPCSPESNVIFKNKLL